MNTKALVAEFIGTFALIFVAAFSFAAKVIERSEECGEAEFAAFVFMPAT